MATQGRVTLDWRAIRPLNGGRDKGFEELCAQLARSENPPGARFIRKGTPDAGVECYSVLADQSEWGWQSKYFDSSDASQWSQIDDSVRTAIEKHPKLRRYFVCVPVDLPDARVPKRKSAKERWDDYVAKWAQLAESRGHDIEFVYWGSSELLDLLGKPEHLGRVRFWFDVRTFDQGWMTARLEEALETAGPRYTPEIHVDVPIVSELEAFGRTSAFFSGLKAMARGVRTALQRVPTTVPDGSSNLDPSLHSLRSGTESLLVSFGAIEVRPIGDLGFDALLAQLSALQDAARDVSRSLTVRENELDAKPVPKDAAASAQGRGENPFRTCRLHLRALLEALDDAIERVSWAGKVAGNSILVLLGAAGTGKTHLLCDVAKGRIHDGAPTILLMGQRFGSHDPPWTQALQQMDLVGTTAEEFVGALEASAQAADTRALLMIDAINEGAGRFIWPSHLPAFLKQIERSPWIGVVLSIRSSYEELVVPAEVAARAVKATHDGFAGNEYDAVKTFFVHFGLELPSTPLLSPEFRNPLFLKTLCKGLQAKGERRLPRGFHGITAVFDLYLDSVDKRLADTFAFRHGDRLVRKALRVIAKAAVDAGSGSVLLARAREIVDAFLPGRDFERSLYRALVAEGLLVEEVAHSKDEKTEVVFLAYERLSDHLTAQLLLERHLDPSDPTKAFEKGGPLAFLCDKDEFVSPGLLEAFCIQIPERMNQELVDLAPACAGRWSLDSAFLGSIVWRAHSAFSDRTPAALNLLGNDIHAVLDALITVATLVGHPMNATFLDRRLRKDTMPDRDSWWSVYLHRSWGTRSAVDRLVDWASSQRPGAPVPEETLDLCAIALSWMFTSSNRFLRDRATQASVTLLSGHLEAVSRLVKRSVDIDDPYVSERIYAVACGVALRSHDAARVGALAQTVYECVFAASAPPAHILLRDYARTVIERALHLGSPITVVVERIRPPYKSSWPTIPSEADVAHLLPDWSKGAHDSGEVDWSRNRIGSSIMGDDFGRYVIGTNGGSCSWLSLRLVDSPWKPQPTFEERLEALTTGFSADEMNAWRRFEAADKEHAGASRTFSTGWLSRKESALAGLDMKELARRLRKARPRQVVALEKKRAIAAKLLMASLTANHGKLLGDLWSSRNRSKPAPPPPRFDLGQIQRYVLHRVFELGWTVERFGEFDRFSIGYHGRDASKAERIGKKYQWIAYHEILALISDHFQYREEFRDVHGDQAYEGPWQDNERDIDPSCPIRSVPGGTSWDGHATAWWGAARYDAWGTPERPDEWVRSTVDLPAIEGLLIATDPADGSRWINGDSYLNWKESSPPDKEPSDCERRELWLMCTGYLLREADTEAFLDWAKSVDFWGRWMPETHSVYSMFLGEHCWAPASRYFRTPYHGDPGWTKPGFNCPVELRTLTFDYLRESGGFDCSVDESFKLRLPVCELLSGLSGRWSGVGGDFVDPNGRLIARDPTAETDGPSAFLLREDAVRQVLAKKGLNICWTVLGEKQAIPPGFGLPPHRPSLRLSGAYALSAEGMDGFITPRLYSPNGGESSAE